MLLFAIYYSLMIKYEGITIINQRYVPACMGINYHVINKYT